MTQLLDLPGPETAEPDRLPGCRLQRLELLNWGTFDRRVWVFDIGGYNTLLTGEIGSGKSTVVDAITTLLLPAHKISYNKAAGADTRERDLRSYVLGYYKAERNETTGASRPVALRDTRHLSVLLGVFANADYGDTVTLAQVFRAQHANQGQPDRFYVVANADMSIAKDFSDFGTELAGLRRKLRDRGARLHGSFPDYGKDFRRHLGIESEQAMDLFHQTVSMKAVDNLNDFVRTHMLEPFDTKDRITKLVEHFDDLTRAHDAVLRARDQLERLQPLIGDLDIYDELTARLVDLRRQQHALPYYFARLTRTLVNAEMTRLGQLMDDIDRALGQQRSHIAGLRKKEQELLVQIAQSGGDRLADIEEEITECERLQPQRRERFARFNTLLEEAGLERITVAEQFAIARDRVADRTQDLEGQRTEADNAFTERSVEKLQLEEDARSINEELRSLQSRKSNLPRISLDLRDRLCTDLGIDPSELPFAGELIQVRDDATEWEGAAERVLHTFALSLLVREAHYGRVAEWIDREHLNARLVYFRVPSRQAGFDPPVRRVDQLLLVDLLEVKPDSEFAPWLHAELDRRANHVCVDAVAEFRSVDKAVTRRGQIKERNRHVKDDRRRIDDRRDYVLGWTNEQKIDALVAHASALQKRLAKVTKVVEGLKAERDLIATQLQRLASVGEYTRWEDLDWQSLVTHIASLRQETERIRSSSNQLQALTDERDRVQTEIDEADEEIRKLSRGRGAAENKQEACQSLLDEADRLLDDRDATALAEPSFPAIQESLTGQLAGASAELAALPGLQQAASQALTKRQETGLAKQTAASNRIVRAMGAFRVSYPQETAELDDSVASAADYRSLHDRVAADDLPRFEREFKEYLNQNTIRDIAGLSAQLNRQEQLIRERIETINGSLGDIDYNDGRYIRLVPDQTPNTDVRQFRADLRACTDDVLGDDQNDHYSEERFLQVKRLVDRFKGREGTAEDDRKWTRKVTDVRQWFVFSASERWRSDDSEYENYTDSAGKSGGQKEKLAYTILAASLAYQFKLDWQAKRSKSFRFVVIDEAFGRGSEASTRYALNLFTRLGLQLLIVTPLQKIHVIEPHVSSVGFVDNPNGDYSRLQCLSITEYRRRRRAQANLAFNPPVE